MYVLPFILIRFRLFVYTYNTQNNKKRHVSPNPNHDSSCGFGALQQNKKSFINISSILPQAIGPPQIYLKFYSGPVIILINLWKYFISYRFWPMSLFKRNPGP